MQAQKGTAMSRGQTQDPPVKQQKNKQREACPMVTIHMHTITLRKLCAVPTHNPAGLHIHTA